MVLGPALGTVLWEAVMGPGGRLLVGSPPPTQPWPWQQYRCTHSAMYAGELRPSPHFAEGVHIKRQHVGGLAQGPMAG